jgi:hypothetical protein
LTIAIHFRAYGGKIIRGNRDNFPPLAGVAMRVRLCRNVMHRRRPRPMRSELPAQLRVIAAAPNAFAA